MVTEAMPSAFRPCVPAKITSSILAPRRLFADCSPKTQLMASLILDLPQPFGPTIPAMPSPWKRSSVRSQKDLNPCNSMRFSLSKALSSARGSCNYTKRAEAKSKVPPPLLTVPIRKYPQYLGGHMLRNPVRAISERASRGTPGYPPGNPDWRKPDREPDAPPHQPDPN